MYNNDLPTSAELPTSKQLLRSSLIALAVAAVLLVTVVLPSEYGIDPTSIGRVLGLTEMGATKMRLQSEAKKDGARDEAAASNTVATQTANGSNQATNTAPESSAPVKTDEMTVTLKPGEAIEIKLEMLKGGRVGYEWSAAGGAVNHDTHGDGAGKAFISYKKGTSVTGDAGELIAAFDGSHGWFWRNRTANEVSITLKTSGAYQSIKRMV